MEIKETMDTGRRSKLRRAKRRVEELKGFYWHLAAYLGVNLFITISKISSNLGNGETFGEAFWDFGTFAIWFFWGIGLAFHAAKVFGNFSLFGRQWEEKKIQQYMDENKD